MLLDHRIYTVRPGTLKEQLALYEQFGWKPQTRHLGEPLAFLHDASDGEVKNAYVHIWVYADAEDRKRKRELLYADPEWQHYNKLNKDAGYLLTQEIRLMSAAGFAPLRRPA